MLYLFEMEKYNDLNDAIYSLVSLLPIFHLRIFFLPRKLGTPNMLYLFEMDKYKDLNDTNYSLVSLLPIFHLRIFCSHANWEFQLRNSQTNYMGGTSFFCSLIWVNMWGARFMPTSYFQSIFFCQWSLSQPYLIYVWIKIWYGRCLLLS